tara:strand:+ start:2926 stop:3123 length:198 start_codon:yes stop_codon:yes gene_type:complete
MNLSQNKDKGVIKSKSLVDLLNKKVELKTELIRLKKEKKQPKKQEVLTESIAMIDEFLSKHKIQK